MMMHAQPPLGVVEQASVPRPSAHSMPRLVLQSTSLNPTPVNLSTRL